MVICTLDNFSFELNVNRRFFSVAGPAHRGALCASSKGHHRSFFSEVFEILFLPLVVKVSFCLSLQLHRTQCHGVDESRCTKRSFEASVTRIANFCVSEHFEICALVFLEG